MLNQISNTKSNLDFDATFVECIWHLRRIPNTNFDASNPTAFDTCRELQGQQNTRRLLSGFWGFRFGILGILFSRYHLRILFQDSVSCSNILETYSLICSRVLWLVQHRIMTGTIVINTESWLVQKIYNRIMTGTKDLQ
jgi:hypothetical protein